MDNEDRDVPRGRNLPRWEKIFHFDAEWSQKSFKMIFRRRNKFIRKKKSPYREDTHFK